ncbi:12868_t:CDS:1 [Funneliformis caledonium]|uniref:12868_t:CDS:1 n=1 Tax=Funneliformis caledonium TaxID=1117310 RepID=A0A9N9FBM0_9GLOM|nr:12868_t:CDS:1 [Funneliformis caledonium]
MEQGSPFDVSLINSPRSLDSESGNMTSSSVEASPNIAQDPPMMLIKPPFPPTINIDDLVTSKPNGDKPSKSSNAFIIYRKAYVKELHSRGINLQMTQISPMVSESWKQEPENVKAEYKRLAEAAKKRYKEMWPSKQRRRQHRKQQQQPQPLPQSLFIDHSKPTNELGLSNLTPTPVMDMSHWDFSQTIWPLGDNHQAISPLQTLSLDPMLLNTTDGLYNNNNTQEGLNPSSTLKSPSDFISSSSTDNSPLINYLINNNERPTGSMPVPNDPKESLLAYHKLMVNWHKDLRRQEQPYKTFAEAMSVSFFAFHLV